MAVVRSFNFGLYGKHRLDASDDSYLYFPKLHIAEKFNQHKMTLPTDAERTTKHVKFGVIYFQAICEATWFFIICFSIGILMPIKGIEGVPDCFCSNSLALGKFSSVLFRSTRKSVSPIYTKYEIQADLGSLLKKIVRI